MVRCTNVECPSPAVQWVGGIAVWVHRDTQIRSCTLESGELLMPPLTQQRTRLPGQLFWCCTTCGTWVPARSFQDGGGDLYARCYGPASARHEPTTWVSAEGREAPPEPVDTTPPLPPQRAFGSAEVTWEYGIEYHYSPNRWHVLPSLVFTDRETAERELAKRQLTFGEGGKHAYRLLKRRAAGAWNVVSVL